MDLIINANQGLHPSSTDRIFSREGAEKFGGLLDWLSPDPRLAFNCFLEYPSEEKEQRAAIELMATIALPKGINVFVVLNGEQLTSQALSDIDAIGLRNMIIRLKNPEKGDKNSLSEKLTNWFSENEGTALSVAFWSDLNNDGKQYQNIIDLGKIGITTDIIDLPLFGPSTQTIPQRSPAIQEEINRGTASCALFQETITLDGAGNLLFCPAHQDTMEEVGNLFRDRPEQLILRKGKCSGQAGKMPICANCDYQGRFSWPSRQTNRTVSLFQKGRFWKGNAPWNPFEPSEIAQEDVSALPTEQQEEILHQFEVRLRNWSRQVENAEIPEGQAMVSVEIPAFKGSWLMPCIESVLYQTSHHWILYTVWDGGDELAKRILQILEACNHPRIKVFFTENQGIARARNFLSAASNETYILPLDDDDLLGSSAVDKYLVAAKERPWASVIRAKRRFIDEYGNLVEMPEWFPFEERHYQHGMVQDLHNHCQPYLISRRAYEATDGWEGFPDFFYAGEDCDIYLKLEEHGAIELVDELLYYYRLNSQRTSHELKPEGAYEMWRRLADKTINRIGLSIRRTNDKPPYNYETLPRAVATPQDISFVVPFFESDEQELEYAYRRPNVALTNQFYKLTGRNSFTQDFDRNLLPCHRLELIFSAKNEVFGTAHLELFDQDTGGVLSTGIADFESFKIRTKTVSFYMESKLNRVPERVGMKIAFHPSQRNYHPLSLLLMLDEAPHAIMRVFRKEPGYSRSLLDRCLNSIRAVDIPDSAIALIQKKQSSSRNRNEGFEASELPYVCYVDDDVEIIAPDTFERLLQIMEETGADLIGPKLITETGALFCADPYFNETFKPVPRGLGEMDHGQYDYTNEVTWLPSTLLLVKREVVKAIGGFDEGYVGSQMEDVDFCLKARLRGFKCVYAGTVPVVHYNHQRNDNFAANFHRFHSRWKAYPQLFTDIKKEENEVASHH